jgi:hypothetical protein
MREEGSECDERYNRELHSCSKSSSGEFEGDKDVALSSLSVK